jgi:glutathione peroxidase
VRDFTAMNSLCEKYGDRLAVLGFICNQFGNQSNGSESEFVKILKHVRPGDGFECAPQLELFQKCEVNGTGQLPMFKWLKDRQKVPWGSAGDSKGNGVDDNDALSQANPTVSWSPIARGDIAWNFEKFLIAPDGKFVRRYSRYFLIGDIAPDIDALLPVKAE